jgi:hypothetical protein
VFALAAGTLKQTLIININRFKYFSEGVRAIYADETGSRYRELIAALCLEGDQ